MSPVKICPGCVVCEGQAHHFVAMVDEQTGEPLFGCRHCDATESLDLHYQPELEEGGVCLTDPEVRLVRFDDSGQRVLESRWRSCIWCRMPIAETYEGSTCGRARCVTREARYLEKHPSAAPREQQTIVNERYF